MIVDSDPPALAVLPNIGGGRFESHTTARRWAAKHPEATGYIVVGVGTIENAVGDYFQVREGAAIAVSAIDCLPNRFARQREAELRRDAERAGKRKRK